jgi:hypothetical protein
LSFPGQYTLAALTPMIINTSENALVRFTPDKRGCYRDEEFHLKTLTWDDGYRYSMNNCLYSSLLEKMFENCSCIPSFFAPSPDNIIDLPMCRYIAELNLKKLFETFHSSLRYVII